MKKKVADATSSQVAHSKPSGNRFKVDTPEKNDSRLTLKITGQYYLAPNLIKSHIAVTNSEGLGIWNLF